MKLRIKDNNLRLRLTQSEVAQLGQGESVRAQIQFSPEQAADLRAGMPNRGNDHRSLSGAYDSGDTAYCTSKSLGQ